MGEFTRINGQGKSLAFAVKDIEIRCDHSGKSGTLIDHNSRTIYDVVGPICETGDTFTRDRALPPLRAGDLVAFMTAGAYGAAMSSEYNSRLLVPEVLVKGDRFAVVRARPTYDDMLARETSAPWLD